MNCVRSSTYGAWSLLLFRREPCRTGSLDQQLEERALRFIVDPEKDDARKELVRIPELYDRKRDDLTRNGALVEHLDPCAEGIRSEMEASVSLKGFYDRESNQNDR
jgi:hypothetical protein